jgi:hypothetical protein
MILPLALVGVGTGGKELWGAGPSMSAKALPTDTGAKALPTVAGANEGTGTGTGGAANGCGAPSPTGLTPPTPPGTAGAFNKKFFSAGGRVGGNGKFFLLQGNQ